jgi:hypothetical protein
VVGQQHGGPCLLPHGLDLGKNVRMASARWTISRSAS